jgi:hypothetical protein
MAAIADQVKTIFLKYVFVGTNLFSSSYVEEPISIETQKKQFDRHYTVIITQVG